VEEVQEVGSLVGGGAGGGGSKGGTHLTQNERREIFENEFRQRTNKLTISVLFFIARTFYFKQLTFLLKADIK
jgi:hypothetical protein